MNLKHSALNQHLGGQYLWECKSPFTGETVHYVGIALLIELQELNGREKIGNIPIYSVFEFGAP